MWPWVQAVGALLDALPPAAREPWHTGELGRLLGPSPSAPDRPDGDSQFRLFERAVSLVGQLSAERPVVLLVDDLQWADAASLGLFGHLATRLPAGTAMFGALRSTAPPPGPALTRMLAAVGRHPFHRRIRLGPLASSEVTELIRRETGRAPDPVVARRIYARTGGNAFFVRELARLLSADGAAARPAVPSTVRDIVRDRTAALDDGDRRLIEIAALMGRDIDVRLVAGAADLDVSRCLAHLESLESHGLVEVVSGPLDRWRFAHDLVRESVVLSTTRSDTGRFHLRIADVLARDLEPVERHAEALAHHLCSAGPLADPKRVVEALVVAGRIAARRSAYDTADRHLDTAARLARDAGLLDLELTALTELTAVSGIHTGFVGATLDHLDRAEEVARSLGQERDATGFLLTRFLAHAQGIRLDAAGRLARRLLDHGRRSPDPVVRASGHHAWGVHQWSSGNIGAAYRNLSRSDALVRAHPDAQPLRHRLQLMTPVMLALNTALHGDLDAARGLFDAVESDAAGDPYAISVWGSFAVTAAAAAGDVAWALRAADTAIRADPTFSFTFSGAYPRLARYWARAMSGDDPAASAIEAERVIESTLVDPPRSNLATWYALLAEIQLRAGDLCAATKALDRADAFIDTYGERYAEGLVLVIRAETLHAEALHAGGDPASAVRAARRALTLSRRRGAHLFATRADRLLAELPG
jgi:tetratricopeptide (TPR) repeat protein